MFGWEFPPHISGGLGTACFGLTKSLAKSDTQILFVVPRADGETTAKELEIINASNILVPLSSEEVKQPERKHIRSTKPTKKEESKIITLRVNADLSPYNSPDVLSGGTSISKWNYQFSKGVVQAGGKVRYQFSGSYGPNLMEEVERYARTATEIAEKKSFDIIHAHDWLTFPAGIAAKKVSAKPLVVHIHATEFDRTGNTVDQRIFKIEREGMEAADRIIAVSQWTKNILTKHYSIPPAKVMVVHNGALAKKQNSDIQQLPIGKKVITFLGRITYQKGPEYFIDAAAKVLEKYPDVHFVMAGSGDLLPAMIERVARLRISSQFHFTGFLKCNQVDKLWSGTHVYVMPSVSEPFGISPLEAVQAGVPVIISNQSGVAEVMHHVIKVDFWNIEALADAMCNLLKYPSLSKMLHKKSKEEIANITWDQAAKKINTLYHELTA